MKSILLLLNLLVLTLVSQTTSSFDQIQHMSYKDFLDGAFSDKTPTTKFLYLDKEIRKQVEDILAHPYKGNRVRYWYEGNRSAWIIDEVGKEMPISIGLVVGPKGIEYLEVLIYRESRGGEIHQAFFTQQFQNIYLDKKQGLSKTIDGITGATLSVTAATKVAKLALIFHQTVFPKNLPANKD